MSKLPVSRNGLWFRIATGWNTWSSPSCGPAVQCLHDRDHGQQDIAICDRPTLRSVHHAVDAARSMFERELRRLSVNLHRLLVAVRVQVDYGHNFLRTAAFPLHPKKRVGVAGLGGSAQRDGRDQEQLGDLRCGGPGSGCGLPGFRLPCCELARLVPPDLSSLPASSQCSGRLIGFPSRERRANVTQRVSCGGSPFRSGFHPPEQP